MTYIPIMGLLSSNRLIINIDKPTYRPGDIIHGTISCAFSETVKMDSLSVTLIGEKKYTNYTMSSVNGVSYSSSKHIFFNERRTLLGHGEHGSQDIPFEYMIPATILPKKFGGFGKIGNFPEWVSTFLNTVIALIGMNGPQYTLAFSLNANADIPWGIDINETIYVGIEQQESGMINIPAPTTNQTSLQ